MPHEHSANNHVHPRNASQNTPPGVGVDSSCPYPNINKYTYPHYRIYVSTLSNTHIYIIKHVHSFHRIRIFTSPHTHFPPPFRGCLRICGHDKSDPYGCERSAKTLRTDCDNPTNTHEMSNEQSVKCATNTPPGVGADSSRPYPNIINYVHSRHQIRVSVSPHTHFPSPLRVCSRICGHDKSAPTAANGLQ